MTLQEWDECKPQFNEIVTFHYFVPLGRRRTKLSDFNYVEFPVFKKLRFYRKDTYNTILAYTEDDSPVYIPLQKLSKISR